jgi:hypothetical protein
VSSKARRQTMKKGDRFGRLKIVRLGDPLTCRCECGKVRKLAVSKWGQVQSCGCLRLDIARERFLHNNPGKKQQPENLRGFIFGRLRVIEYFGRAPSGHPLWKCRCQCGNTHIVRADSLLQNRTKSCGCLREEIARLRRKRSNAGTEKG